LLEVMPPEALGSNIPQVIRNLGVWQTRSLNFLEGVAAHV